MTQPTVVCVMLTRDRPEIAARAVRSFRKQTYENKALVIWDTSHEMDPAKRLGVSEFRPDVQHMFYGPQVNSIGTLRNNAISYATSYVTITLPQGKYLMGDADIIAHFDDDDYSHPNRLTEQVALLQASGADAVGYNEMLFADMRVVGWQVALLQASADSIEIETGPLISMPEAWLYTSPSPSNVPGTGLCYWRKTWERKPFPDLPRAGCVTGEDWQWQVGLNVAAVSVMHGTESFPDLPKPRMIATIHGGNTSGQYQNLSNSTSWNRVSMWDSYCRRTLETA